MLGGVTGFCWGEIRVVGKRGIMCFGHLVGASGILMTYELYKQIQRKAEKPERQVKNPRRGLSHVFGARPQMSAVAIFGNKKG
jgi:acetyl-CoA C-acetyltransferase